MDAAWLGAGGRQVTSPKVNADGCAGKHHAAASAQPSTDPPSPGTAHRAARAAAGGEAGKARGMLRDNRTAAQGHPAGRKVRPLAELLFQQ